MKLQPTKSAIKRKITSAARLMPRVESEMSAGGVQKP